MDYSKDLSKEISFAEKYGTAMDITTQEDADVYLETLIRHNMSFGHSREEATTIEKSNLGYYAGYYSDDTRRRVEFLFQCEHPIFGSIIIKGSPTPEEAFQMGVELGKANFKKKK